jgi:hypothetical protein
MSVKGPFMSLDTDFHMIKITVLQSSYTAHRISKSSGSLWHLDSSKLKYQSEKNQYHIFKSRACRLSVEGEASDAGQGSCLRSASPNKMHSRCGVCRVWTLFTSFFGRSVGGAGSTLVTLQKIRKIVLIRSLRLRTFYGPEMYSTFGNSCLQEDRKARKRQFRKPVRTKALIKRGTHNISGFFHGLTSQKEI